MISDAEADAAMRVAVDLGEKVTDWLKTSHSDPSLGQGLGSMMLQQYLLLRMDEAFGFDVVEEHARGDGLVLNVRAVPGYLVESSRFPSQEFFIPVLSR